jgi:hypothetical protein
MEIDASELSSGKMNAIHRRSARNENFKVRLVWAGGPIVS